MSESAVLVGKLEWMGSKLLELNHGLIFDEGLVTQVQVPDATTDQAVSFGLLTSAEMLVIRTDQTITIKLNGSSDALTVGSLLILQDTVVTSLSISNASGSTASVMIMILGT